MSVINNYIESFFEEIPFSTKAEAAKTKILETITKEYNELLKNNSKRVAFSRIVKKYSSLELLAKATGYTNEDVKSWTSSEDVADEALYLKHFRRERIHIYTTTFFGLAAIGLFLETLANFSPLFLAAAIFCAAFAIVDFILYERSDDDSRFFSLDSYDHIRKSFDKYTVRSTFWLFVFFAVLGGAITNVINISLNLKIVQLASYFASVFLAVSLPLFFAIKNMRITHFIFQKATLAKRKIFWNNYLKSLIFCSIYWLSAIFIFYLFDKVFVVNPVVVLQVIFDLIALAIFYSSKKSYCYKETRINKIAVAIVSVVVIVVGGYAVLSRDYWLTQPYINSRPNISNNQSEIEYNNDTGVYTITMTEDDFKILQLTDIHLGGGPISYRRDMQALQAVYKLIDHTRPDFVIVTGDLTFPVGYSSFSFNNTAPVQQFASFMRNLGIPWAFAYGNHDTESYATTSEVDLKEVYKSLSYKSSKTLLYPYVQPDITGRNNQLIELRNKDGSLNQAIVIIDSNAYTGEGFNTYDYIHDDQVAWYKKQIEDLEQKEGYTISSLVFFHIPLQEYVTAYDLYQQGSSEVKYYFGENNDEVMDVSDHPSKLFDTAVELGSTKGMFCGHDHYNNTSIEYKGIRLTYGMSIDYLAMPGIARDTKQRGATLITTHKDSSFDIEQVPLTSIEQYYPQDDWLVEL